MFEDSVAAEKLHLLFKDQSINKDSMEMIYFETNFNTCYPVFLFKLFLKKSNSYYELERSGSDSVSGPTLISKDVFNFYLEQFKDFEGKEDCSFANSPIDYKMIVVVNGQNEKCKLLVVGK
jgi:hypothetical protein